jgi:bifunctional enzyme CysN/CysC
MNKPLQREQMDIVIVGHVDHGKSTVIGRLMADTGSLPEGKLEQVQEMCRQNARPFEYAFLLDALKNEQAQGITIDTARCFFHTGKRNYILHDAPGHIEFLKNMVTGAARAEAALLVIDAAEGVQENSKRHGYMVSMLGIKQIAVLINKMDLADYSEETFNSIKDEYLEFLAELGVHPAAVIPVSAREGENITQISKAMSWYTGHTVIDQVEDFHKVGQPDDEAFRMPVQDVYKFTAEGDERRIFAGTILTGKIAVGDEIVLQPSGKESTVRSIEAFNADTCDEISAGFATGLTLETQIYVKPGELMSKKSEDQPQVARRFRVNLFWMGRPPMVKDKSYKLKIGSAAVPAELAEIIQVLDASELSSVTNKEQVDRHDVAECILETTRPIAVDERNTIEATGRVVIVDEHEIAGAGVILEVMRDDHSVMQEHIQDREYAWEKGTVSPEERSKRFNHSGSVIVLNGIYGCGKRRIAKQLEQTLFEKGCNTYYFGVSNYFQELDHDAQQLAMDREQHLEQLGQLARVVTDAGMLFITTIFDGDDFELERLALLTSPHKVMTINVGENVFNRFPIDVQLPYRPDMDEAIDAITQTLNERDIFPVS